MDVCIKQKDDIVYICIKKAILLNSILREKLSKCYIIGIARNWAFPILFQKKDKTSIRGMYICICAPIKNYIAMNIETSLIGLDYEITYDTKLGYNNVRNFITIEDLIEEITRVNNKC